MRSLPKASRTAAAPTFQACEQQQEARVYLRQQGLRRKTPLFLGVHIHLFSKVHLPEWGGFPSFDLTFVFACSAAVALGSPCRRYRRSFCDRSQIRRLLACPPLQGCHATTTMLALRAG